MKEFVFFVVVVVASSCNIATAGEDEGNGCSKALEPAGECLKDNEHLVKLLKDLKMSYKIFSKEIKEKFINYTKCAKPLFKKGMEKFHSWDLFNKFDEFSKENDCQCFEKAGKQLEKFYYETKMLEINKRTFIGLPDCYSKYEGCDEDKKKKIDNNFLDIIAQIIGITEEHYEKYNVSKYIEIVAKYCENCDEDCDVKIIEEVIIERLINMNSDSANILKNECLGYFTDSLECQNEAFTLTHKFALDYDICIDYFDYICEVYNKENVLTELKTLHEEFPFYELGNYLGNLLKAIDFVGIYVDCKDFVIKHGESHYKCIETFYKDEILEQEIFQMAGIIYRIGNTLVETNNFDEKLECLEEAFENNEEKIGKNCFLEPLKKSARWIILHLLDLLESNE